MNLGMFRHPLGIAFAALSLLAFAAEAQTGVRGRSLFEQKNCSQCHAYEARSLGPSVRKMKLGLKGDPARASTGISAAADHASDLKSMTPADIRDIAEWLAATSFAEVAAEATKPPANSAEARRQAAAKAKQEAEAKARQEAQAKAQAKLEAVAKAKRDADARMQAKRDALAKARADAEAKAQASKEAAARARQEADAKAQARRDTEAQAKREATAKQESAELAKREADARARKDTAALDAIKRESEERARRDADTQAVTKREAEAKVKREADALATQKRDADDRSRLEGEAKAKREAEALAAQKRDTEARAKKDADALAAQKKEAEAQAQARKPEPAAAKPDPAAKVETAAPGAKKKLAYRDGSDLPACPAPTGAALGAVDEERAKAIIERVGCPQCHAYVQKKTGPPMKQINEKYKGDWECVVFRLTKNKTHKEEGVTDDLKGGEFKIVADYIATRGK